MFQTTDSLPTQDTAAEAAELTARKPHTDLARWAHSAVKRHGYARSLSTHEQDALAQQVVVQVLNVERKRPDRGHSERPRCATAPAPTRSRDVLAWIAHVERTQLWNVDERTLPLADLDAGARYAVLSRAVQTALESPHWQDHSARYRSAAKAQRDSGPRVVPDTGAEGGLLALALEHDSARLDTSPTLHLLSPILDEPWSACDVALALALDHGWNTATARNVALALERARCVASAEVGKRDSAALALCLSVAAQRETTLNAVQAAASRGLAALASVPVEDALRVMRHSARLTQRGEHIALAAAAAEAVKLHAMAGGSWDPDSIHSARSLPDRAPNTARTQGPALNRANRTTDVPVARFPLGKRSLTGQRQARRIDPCEDGPVLTRKRKPVVQVRTGTRLPLDAPTASTRGTAADVLRWIDYGMEHGADLAQPIEEAGPAPSFESFRVNEPN